jgi:hypothetical protein
MGLGIPLKWYSPALPKSIDLLAIEFLVIKACLNEGAFLTSRSPLKTVFATLIFLWWGAQCQQIFRSSTYFPVRVNDWTA